MGNQVPFYFFLVGFIHFGHIHTHIEFCFEVENVGFDGINHSFFHSVIVFKKMYLNSKIYSRPNNGHFKETLWIWFCTPYTMSFNLAFSFLFFCFSFLSHGSLNSFWIYAFIMKKKTKKKSFFKIKKFIILYKGCFIFTIEQKR